MKEHNLPKWLESKVCDWVEEESDPFMKYDFCQLAEKVVDWLKAHDSAKVDTNVYFEIWNENRAHLPAVTKYTEGRKRKVSCRVTSGLTPERFKEAVLCCVKKPHLRGDNGWTADFDWLIKNDDNIEKAINNPYGLKPEPPPKPERKICLDGEWITKAQAKERGIYLIGAEE